MCVCVCNTYFILGCSLLPKHWLHAVCEKSFVTVIYIYFLRLELSVDTRRSPLCCSPPIGNIPELSANKNLNKSHATREIRVLKRTNLY